MSGVKPEDVVDHILTASVVRLAFQQGFVGKHPPVEEFKAFVVQNKTAATSEEQHTRDEADLIKHLKFLSFLSVSALTEGDSQILAVHSGPLLDQALGTLATAAEQIRRLFRLRNYALAVQKEKKDEQAKKDKEAAEEKHQSLSTGATPSPVSQPPGGPAIRPSTAKPMPTIEEV